MSVMLDGKRVPLTRRIAARLKAEAEARVEERRARADVHRYAAKTRAISNLSEHAEREGDKEILAAIHEEIRALTVECDTIRGRISERARRGGR